MARRPEKVNFQLSLYPEEKAMIKADAKAAGLPVARYVARVCTIANECTKEAREKAMKEMKESLAAEMASLENTRAER